MKGLFTLIDKAEQIKIFIYQYFMFNSDRFADDIRQYQYFLKNCPRMTSDDIYKCLLLQVQYEVFNRVERELFSLLKMANLLP